jgi:hypothetical protein
MPRAIPVLAAAVVLAGCARTRYYADAEGKTELPGLPFTWIDKDGQPRQAYASATTGFGTASFEIHRTEAGGYTRFSQNLDSTAAAELAGSIVDRAFDAGMKAGAAAREAEVRELKAKMRQVLQSLPDSPARAKALEDPLLR